MNKPTVTKQKAAEAILTGVNVSPDQPSIHPGNTPRSVEFARFHWRAGLNVFPVPQGSKIPGNEHSKMRWKMARRVRLAEDHVHEVFQGRSNIAVVCGDISGGLFVLDCESKEVLKQTALQMHRRGIPVFGWKTSKGGHILLRVPEGQKAPHSISTGTIPDMEIRSEGAYVLAAGSVHPSGDFYEFFTPAHIGVQPGDSIPRVELYALDWLRDGNGQPVQLKPRNTHDTRKALDWYIKNGPPATNRNNALFKAACSARKNGYSQAEAADMLLPIFMRGRASETDAAYAREGLGSITSAYNGYKQNGQPGQRTGTLTKVQALAASDIFRGRTGSTDRRVFLALIERFRMDVEGVDIGFRASVREIAELAHMDKMTAGRALKRLCSADSYLPCPLIKLVFPGGTKSQQAHIYAFTDTALEIPAAAAAAAKDEKQKSDVTHTVGYAYKNMLYSVCNSSLSPDILERGALGINGIAIYRLLMMHIQDGLRTKDIATELGLTYRAVRYALRKDGLLVQGGFVGKRGRNWVAIPKTSDEISSAGTREKHRGRSETRKRKHADDRSELLRNNIVTWRKRHDRGYRGHPSFEETKVTNSMLELEH